MNFAEQLVPKATLLWGATRWTVESIDDDAVIMTNASNKQLRSFPRPFIDSTAIKGNIKIFIMANPMSAIIETFRYAFLGVGNFSWGGLAYSFATMIILLLIGTITFNKVEKTFMDTV